MPPVQVQVPVGPYYEYLIQKMLFYHCHNPHVFSRICLFQYRDVSLHYDTWNKAMETTIEDSAEINVAYKMAGLLTQSVFQHF